MITVEIVDDLRELDMRISKYKIKDNNGIFAVDYETAMQKLTSDGRKRWFFITYRGAISDMKTELSLLKYNDYHNFVADISAKEISAMDIVEIMDQIYAITTSEYCDVEFNVTDDDSICDGKTVVQFIVPEYELGWQMQSLLREKDRVKGRKSGI